MRGQVHIRNIPIMRGPMAFLTQNESWGGVCRISLEWVSSVSLYMFDLHVWTLAYRFEPLKRILKNIIYEK